MTAEREHRFGGKWTQQKLECLRKYLAAYTIALKGKPTPERPFRKGYIDAFAGTGYWQPNKEPRKADPLLIEMEDEDVRGFATGSAQIALEVDPSFDGYVFIDSSPARCEELEKLKEEYPLRAGAIVVKCQDANTYLHHLCHDLKEEWRFKRAVLFLDPYGMQVKWETIRVVAETKAIDLWILFPLGPVMRLLRSDGEIPEANRRRLDELFGATDWYETFYSEQTTQEIFGPRTQTQRQADFDAIKHYWVQRLRTVFEDRVAANPLVLCNSKVPIYLLCFACGSETGAKSALRIANHILRGMANG